MTANLEELIDACGMSERTFWKETIDTMNEALLIVNPERRIIYLNKMAEILIGSTLEEVVGKVCIEAINCPNCECVCKLFRDGTVDNLPVTVFCRTDSNRQILLKNARLLRDKEGRIIGGVETFKDVSDEARERKEKEERMDQIFREKKRMEALLHSLSEGVFSVDRKMQVLDFSHRMTEITGFLPEQALGRNFHRLFEIQENARFGKDLDALFDQKWNIDIRRADGNIRNVEVTFHPIRFQTDEVLGLMIDKSENLEEVTDFEKSYRFQGLISCSPKMIKIFRLVEKAADGDANILVCGETGTGKELVAKAVHRLSNRRDAPFKAVNCATFRGELLLSELFGHEKGAFTGADKLKRGKLEMAAAGTLFLDEVHEIPIEHQSLLLRVLEERAFERVGGHDRIEMNARIIAASNVNLIQAVKAGRFRRDLFHRLNVIPIHVPPLRERKEDVELLLKYFLRQAGMRANEVPRCLSSGVVEILKEYDWPGNVRELKNMIEYLNFMCDKNVEIDDLPAEIFDHAHKGIAEKTGQAELRTEQTLTEKDRLLAALEATRYNKTKAAKRLGINRSTLWRRMKKLGIDNIL